MIDEDDYCTNDYDYNQDNDTRLLFEIEIYMKSFQERKNKLFNLKCRNYKDETHFQEFITFDIKNYYELYEVMASIGETECKVSSVPKLASDTHMIMRNIAAKVKKLQRLMVISGKYNNRIRERLHGLKLTPHGDYLLLIMDAICQDVLNDILPPGYRYHFVELRRTLDSITSKADSHGKI